MAPENPFVFGEIIGNAKFVDRTDELDQLVRDLADGQKVFLLSPRRFGKSSLVSVAMLKLQKRHGPYGESHLKAAIRAMLSFSNNLLRKYCEPLAHGTGSRTGFRVSEGKLSPISTTTSARV